MDKFGEIRSGINSDREEKSGAEEESGEGGGGEGSLDGVTSLS